MVANPHETHQQQPSDPIPITLNPNNNPNWAKRVRFLGTAPRLSSLCSFTVAMLGAYWAFLGLRFGQEGQIFRHRAPSTLSMFIHGGHVGCILGLSWFTLGQEGQISRHRGITDVPLWTLEHSAKSTGRIRRPRTTGTFHSSQHQLQVAIHNFEF